MEGGGFTVGSFTWSPGTEQASTYRSDMEAAVRREPAGHAAALYGHRGREMMRVPRSARPSTMSVKVPRDGGYGGEFEQPVEVRRVRFEPVSAWLVREYALGDGAQGLVIADGADSPGMFDVPVGSRVSIDGGEWMNVARCTPRRAFGTRPHHWELEVR